MGFAQVDLLRVFSSLNQAYRVRSCYLSTRRGRNEQTDYVLEFKTLMAVICSDHLTDTVCVTVFMEGLRTGVTRTEVFRVHSFFSKRLWALLKMLSTTLSRPDLVQMRKIQDLRRHP